MRIAHSRVVIEAPAAEETLVAQAIAAREQGEKSSWQEADCYADLSQCGWTQQRIAERCKTTQPRVSKYIACAEKYSVANNRPSFWEAYSEVDGKRRLTGYSSASDEWETPQELFEALDGEFHFTLDVCATKANAKCRRFFTEQDDGLAQEWSGVCWMNPPYGDAIEAWVRKASEAAWGGATVVCLVPARVDTAWWWDYCAHGEVRCLRGRLKFGASETSAPFPSAVVVFRPGLPRVRGGDEWYVRGWEWPTQ